MSVTSKDISKDTSNDASKDASEIKNKPPKGKTVAEWVIEQFKKSDSEGCAHCGTRGHKPPTCFYLRPDLRPDNWTPNFIIWCYLWIVIMLESSKERANVAINTETTFGPTNDFSYMAMGPTDDDSVT